jgi:hypothetical protein
MPKCDPTYESRGHTGLMQQDEGNDLCWTLGAFLEAPDESPSQVIGVLSDEKRAVRLMADSGSPVTDDIPTSSSSAVSNIPSGGYTDVNVRAIYPQTVWYNEDECDSESEFIDYGEFYEPDSDDLDITKDILVAANSADQGSWTNYGPCGGWIQSPPPLKPPLQSRDDSIREGNHHGLDVLMTMVGIDHRRHRRRLAKTISIGFDFTTSKKNAWRMVQQLMLKTLRLGSEQRQPETHPRRL